METGARDGMLLIVGIVALDGTGIRLCGKLGLLDAPLGVSEMLGA